MMGIPLSCRKIFMPHQTSAQAQGLAGHFFLGHAILFIPSIQVSISDRLKRINSKLEPKDPFSQSSLKPFTNAADKYNKYSITKGPKGVLPRLPFHSPSSLSENSQRRKHEKPSFKNTRKS
jgi:hypothetical protein